jgi:hypoxanthine phosphoribosyltransferase
MPLSDEDMYRVMGPTSMSPDELGRIKKEKPKTFYSWEHFHVLVNEIKKQVKTAPDIIVSVGKGGAIPGVILAESYGVNNLNIGLKSYDKQDRGKIHEYQSLPDNESLKDMNILLVDDIADSGSTFTYTLNRLKGHFCDKVQTASVFYKPCSKFKPHYIGLEVDADTWIVQPWE